MERSRTESSDRAQAPIAQAELLMRRFADRTGLASPAPPTRYLWTDAFAVCNFLGLARATGDPGYVELARQTVDAVHQVLGRHRPDDSRSGWLSGLTDVEASRHPTAGGLRIGKRLPERAAGQPLDSELEWQRDGQYFHYLTKWMHALDQLARHSLEPCFNSWARELALTAHRAFVYVVRHDRDSSAHSRMYWKMSVDLSRPLVASMGQHDPLDGFVTCLELARTAVDLRGCPDVPNLKRQTESFFHMVDPDALATDDPLGIGGLLFDAWRIYRLRRSGEDRGGELLPTLFAASARGLQRYLSRATWRASAERRLAFRELGLAIGLKAIPLMAIAQDDGDSMPGLAALTDAVDLADAINAFWLEPDHQRTESWIAHRDINDVMLAASLVPAGFLSFD